LGKIFIYENYNIFPSKLVCGPWSKSYNVE